MVKYHDVFLLHMLFRDMNRDKGIWYSPGAYDVSPHSDPQEQKDTHRCVHPVHPAFFHFFRAGFCLY